MNQVVVRITRLDPDAVVPTYAHPGDAGADLSSNERITLEPGERAAVSTGVAIAIPDGYVGLVHPRSGLAIDAGLTVVNAPGTIDSGYRGELKVLLINLGQEPVTVEPRDRIAQLVVQAVSRAELIEMDELPDSHRGDGGLGSTGVSDQQ